MRWSVLTIALALGACASGLDERSTEERKADWAAQNVYPANYRAELLAYLRTYLNDPTGVREAASPSRRCAPPAWASAISCACASTPSARAAATRAPRSIW